MKRWSPNGWCEIPKTTVYSYDFILSVDGEIVDEDYHLNPQKITSVPDGYVVHNVTGIRAHMVSRLDSKGYDVTKLGPFAVKTGQIVYINDTDLILGPNNDEDGRKRADKSKSDHRISNVPLHFYLDHVDPMLDPQPLAIHDMPSEAVFTASTALFGGDPRAPMAGGRSLRFGRGDGVRLVREPENPHGCLPYQQYLEDEAVLVARGECTFLEKLILAQAAGASGVVVISNEDTHINPSASPAEVADAGDAIDDVAIVVLPRAAGEIVGPMVAAAEAEGLGRVIVTIASEPVAEGGAEVKNASKGATRVLYLNGHPLLNTRLLI